MIFVEGSGLSGAFFAAWTAVTITVTFLIIKATILPKIKVEVVVSKIPVEKVIEKAKEVLYTGHIGDGKIFVYNVGKVVKISTGEENYAALQDVE